MQVDEVKEFVMNDRLGELVVKGQLIADYRLGSMSKPRWTDMALYRIADEEPLRTEEVIKQLVVDRMNNTQRAALAGYLPRLTALVFDAQPTYRYALEIIARSYVYHRLDSDCVSKRHGISTVGDIKESNHRWRHLFPCERCKPSDLEHMMPTDRVAEERSDARVSLCATASDIVDRLYQRNGEISVMAAKLIKTAAHRDPDIAKVLATPRRVRGESRRGPVRRDR